MWLTINYVRYLKENLASLKKRKILEGFSGETPAPV